MKRSALTSGSKPSTTLMLLALIVGAIAAILDTTIVAIGMRTLTVELRAPLTTIQWVSTGYLLSLAVTIPFVGWAQARIGGKRLWLLALGLFVLGSALCGFAWNAPALIGFRLLQGIGGGIMLPLMQTLAMQHVPAERKPGSWLRLACRRRSGRSSDRSWEGWCSTGLAGVGCS